VIMQGLGCYSLDNTPRAEGYGAVISALEQKGFVTMRVEKTGEGDSEGPACSDPGSLPDLEAAGWLAGLRALKQYDFVDPSKLKKSERESWAILPELVRLAGDHAKRVKEIRISNTMRLDEGAYETEGVWDSPHIVVKRSVLDSRRHFARVLLHEIAHASSGANHGSIPFMAAIDDLAALGAMEAARASLARAGDSTNSRGGA